MLFKYAAGVVCFLAVATAGLALADEPGQPAAGRTIRLFDGRSLDGWKVSDFAGGGEVKVENGQLILGFGEFLTGVVWDTKAAGKDRQLPREDYEISLEAKRVDGADFFCGLTFPVGDAPCSLIVGGWGGGVIGLSSINGFDASENETSDYMEFENGRWYKIRLRVTKDKVEAWIDDKQIVDVDREGRTFTIRVEVELSKPLGIASWQTTAALRNIVLTRLGEPPSPSDIKQPAGVKSSGDNDPGGVRAAPPRRRHLRFRRRRGRCA